METLFVNACARPDSRTLRLAKYFLTKYDKKLGNINMHEVRLEDENIKPLDFNALEKRNKILSEKHFDDEMLRYARQFVAADSIVIAAPYWDMSFPSMLKNYIEAVNAIGVTFVYGEDGRPHGLCKAKKLVYITTAGGPIISDDYGFGYINGLCNVCYGIKDVSYIKAEFLDVEGANIDEVLQKSFEDADRILSNF